MSVKITVNKPTPKRPSEINFKVGDKFFTGVNQEIDNLRIITRGKDDTLNVVCFEDGYSVYKNVSVKDLQTAYGSFNLTFVEFEAIELMEVKK
jgi:hypothetical protein